MNQTYELNNTVKVFIQARMSSTRFPGKVLAPFNGKPVIAHVIERVNAAMPLQNIVVATSTEESDEPLVCYLNKMGVSVFRGDSNNVFNRFKACLKEHPCNYFFRVCADSPLLDSKIFEAMLKYSNSNEFDLVTNTFPRTFPSGHSLEMIKSNTYESIDENSLSSLEEEHATQVFYNRSENYKIKNIESGKPELAKENSCIDTIEDLIRLQKQFK